MTETRKDRDSENNHKEEREIRSVPRMIQVISIGRIKENTTRAFNHIMPNSAQVRLWPPASHLYPVSVFFQPYPLGHALSGCLLSASSRTLCSATAGARFAASSCRFASAAAASFAFLSASSLAFLASTSSVQDADTSTAKYRSVRVVGYSTTWKSK